MGLREWSRNLQRPQDLQEPEVWTLSLLAALFLSFSQVYTVFQKLNDVVSLLWGRWNVYCCLKTVVFNMIDINWYRPEVGLLLQRSLENFKEVKRLLRPKVWNHKYKIFIFPLAWVYNTGLTHFLNVSYDKRQVNTWVSLQPFEVIGPKNR